MSSAKSIADGVESLNKRLLVEIATLRAQLKMAEKKIAKLEAERDEPPYLRNKRLMAEAMAAIKEKL